MCRVASTTVAQSPPDLQADLIEGPPSLRLGGSLRDRVAGMGRMKRTWNRDGTVQHHDLSLKSAEKEQFIEWLATPQHARDPYSYRELAEALEVDYSTLMRWKKQDDVVSAVAARTREVFAVENLSGLVDNLKAIALDESQPAGSRVSATAKLLDWHLKTAPKEQSTAPLADMSIAELKGLAAELYDELDERQADTA